MIQDDEQKKKEATILDNGQIKIIIPECCREGWDSCPHVPKRLRAKKRNIAL